jgi:hypothetical protein
VVEEKVPFGFIEIENENENENENVQARIV